MQLRCQIWSTFKLNFLFWKNIAEFNRARCWKSVFHGRWNNLPLSAVNLSFSLSLTFTNLNPNGHNTTQNFTIVEEIKQIRVRDFTKFVALRQLVAVSNSITKIVRKAKINAKYEKARNFLDHKLTNYFVVKHCHKAVEFTIKVFWFFK